MSKFKPNWTFDFKSDRISRVSRIALSSLTASKVQTLIRLAEIVLIFNNFLFDGEP